MKYAPSERGQGLVEYGLILVLIAIAAVIIITQFGQTLNAIYIKIVSMFP